MKQEYKNYLDYLCQAPWTLLPDCILKIAFLDLCSIEISDVVTKILWPTQQALDHLLSEGKDRLDQETIDLAVQMQFLSFVGPSLIKMQMPQQMIKPEWVVQLFYFQTCDHRQKLLDHLDSLISHVGFTVVLKTWLDQMHQCDSISEVDCQLICQLLDHGDSITLANCNWTLAMLTEFDRICDENSIIVAMSFAASRIICEIAADLLSGFDIVAKIVSTVFTIVFSTLSFIDSFCISFCISSFDSF